MKSMTAVESRKERRGSPSLRLLATAILLCIWAVLLGGCNWAEPGETSKEVSRRHERVLRLDTQMMMSDIDRALLLDRPSHLTDKRLP